MKNVHFVRIEIAAANPLRRVSSIYSPQEPSKDVIK